jgi:hypothetical protein
LSWAPVIQTFVSSLVLLFPYLQSLLSVTESFFSSGLHCPKVGKVTLKSNGDEELNNEFLLKSNGDEALNDVFSIKSNGDEAFNAA